MTDIAPYLVIGITNGSIYALAALGLVLTFRTSGVFNFGHGALAALAAYLMFEFRDRMGLPWPLAALLALFLAGVVAGLILERVAHGLSTASTAARVAATVGLVVGIPGILVIKFGSAALQMRYFLPTRLVSIAGINVRVEQLIVTIVVAVAAVALFLFLGRSRTGAAMQAVVDDPSLLGLQGTNPLTVRRCAWIIGSCFAAVSGVLLAPTTGLDPYGLTLLVFFAFGAASVGAFDSLILTYAGGIGIGIASSLLTKYATTDNVLASLPATLPFIVLFAALLVLPRERLVERGRQTIRRAMPPLKLSRPVQLVAIGAAIVGLLAVPNLVGAKLPLYMTALPYAILFLSLSLLVRTSGQISLCQMSFAAVGATTFSHAHDAGVPWTLAVLLGAFVAVPVGAIVAIPAIRLSGVYLAIATFGFALLVERLFFPSFLMFGKPLDYHGVPRPVMSGVALTSDTGYYYVLLLATLVCCGIVLAVHRGRLGRLLRGLADAPVALDANGLNTNVTRVWVFAVAAFLAGMAGALLAPITGSLTRDGYNFVISLLLVSVLFISGRQPIVSAFVAAGFYLVLPGYISDPSTRDWMPVLFGVGAILAAVAGGRPIIARLTGSKRSAERESRGAVRSLPGRVVEAGA